MKMTHDIRLADAYRVKRVNSVEVKKSVHLLSDTATLSLPLRAGNAVYEIPEDIKTGAKVSIKLGYDGKNEQEFTGYVDSIKQDKDLRITCEDGAWLLRKPVDNKEYKDVTMGAMLRDIVGQAPGLSVSVSQKLASLPYDKFTVKDQTAYEVLKKIADEWRLHIYVREKVVYAALKYELTKGSVSYRFDANVEKAALSYQRAADRKVRVEVVGIDKNNQKTTEVVGDKDGSGDSIKIDLYNVSSNDALRAIGEGELVKWKSTGYKGALVSWLLPYCSYGYSAEVIDDDYRERSGAYYVDAVTTTYSPQGGKRKITLGIKIT